MYFSRALLFAFVCIAFNTTSHAQGTPGVDAKEIRIGVSLPISGDHADMSLAFLKGLQTCVSNATGIYGRHITLLPLNDFNEPHQALANTMEFIQAKASAEQVFAVMGYLGDSTAEKAVPELIKAKIPVLGVLSSSAALDAYNGDSGFFPLRTNDQVGFEALVNQIKTMQIKKIGIIYDNSPSGVRRLAMLDTWAKIASLTVVKSIALDSNGQNVKASVPTMLAANPELIVALSSFPSTIEMIKQTKLAKYVGLYFLPAGAGARHILKKYASKPTDNVVYVQTLPSVLDNKSAAAKQFIARLKPADISYANDDTALEGCLAGDLLVEGLRRSGPGLTRDKFRASLNSKPVVLHELTLVYGAALMSHNLNPRTAILYSDGSMIR
jgi:branched-chain amino acid transport system substrate-binding protein